jgi:branched-chain amino acid transport system substrate-binding protein
MDADGVRLALEEVNEKGGLLGRQVRLMTRDAKLNPALAGSLTRDAIQRANVDFFFGAISSAVTLGVSSVCKEYKRVLMVNTSSNENIIYQQGHPYVFMSPSNGIMSGRAVGVAVHKKGFKKIITVSADYVTGHDLVKRMKEKLAALGSDAKVVKEFYVKPGETDFGPHIAGIMSTDADLVWANLWGSDQLTFFKQAGPLGLYKKFNVGMIYVTSDVLEALGKDGIPDGVLCQHRAPLWALSGPGAKNFVAKYRAKFGYYPNEYAVLAYINAHFLCEAIKKAKTTNADAVVRELEKLKMDTVLAKKMYFRSSDHQLNAPQYFGLTKKTSDYEFSITGDFMMVAAEECWTSDEEIKALKKW